MATTGITLQWQGVPSNLNGGVPPPLLRESEESLCSFGNGKWRRLWLDVANSCMVLPCSINSLELELKVVEQHRNGLQRPQHTQYVYHSHRQRPDIIVKVVIKIAEHQEDFMDHHHHHHHHLNPSKNTTPPNPQHLSATLGLVHFLITSPLRSPCWPAFRCAWPAPGAPSAHGGTGPRSAPSRWTCHGAAGAGRCRAAWPPGCCRTPPERSNMTSVVTEGTEGTEGWCNVRNARWSCTWAEYGGMVFHLFSAWDVLSQESSRKCWISLNRSKCWALKGWQQTLQGSYPNLVGGLEHDFYDFPYIGNIILPTDEVIFFRGVGIPPTRIGKFPWFQLHGVMVVPGKAEALDMESSWWSWYMAWTVGPVPWLK